MTVSEFEIWKQELHEARAGSGEESGFDRFFELLERARGGGLAEAKALVGTICSEPEDNGQGEAALSMLSEFADEVQAVAVVEELDRLMADGEGAWARSLVEMEARFRPQSLVRAANGCPSQTRACVRSILGEISLRAISRGAVDIAGPLVELLVE